jgi:lipopolysaccharide biosynthesis regulator YciM
MEVKVLKRDDKIKIIKWFIASHCGLCKIQTLKDSIDDLKHLESLVMQDRAAHCSNCSTCWYSDRDYNIKCPSCKEYCNYTFPYGYWKKFYERETE